MMGLVRGKTLLRSLFHDRLPLKHIAVQPIILNLQSFVLLFTDDPLPLKHILQFKLSF